jgi:tetratricopeptide (TPR) repeat protein
MTDAKLTLDQVLYRAHSASRAGNFVEAEELCQRIITARPDCFDAINLLAFIRLRSGQAAAALETCDRAISLRPSAPVALNNRGLALQELGRAREALASFDRAIALQPDYAAALDNRGNALRQLKRFEEALASFDRAIKLVPDYADAYYNRGLTFQEVGRFEGALASYDRAIQLRPDHAAAFNNRGNTLQELGRFDVALASYDQAITLQHDYAQAHLNRAFCWLLHGDFERGWKEYEWRLKKPSTKPERPFPKPLWLGERELSGRTILLHAEQGFGDTIQFCRYVSLVAERGARVILEVEEPLKDLVSSLTGVGEVVAAGSVLPDFDVHCPLPSLPLVFATNMTTIPSKVPYLKTSPQRVADWNERLGPRNRPRIGLAWSGRPRPANRSVPLNLMLPLLDCDALFVSLQKQVRPQDASILGEQRGIIHFGHALKDFSDTAAVIANLDLVISIDTSVAHLAGALAKPVWVLLSFTPDWRWLLERNDSPWYPTARVFRQNEKRTWGTVIERVRVELSKFIERY